MPKGRVFVVQQPMKGHRPAFDYTPAERFGEVFILMSNDNLILAPEVFQRELQAKLVEHNFNPSADFIIATGDYSVLFYVGMIVGKIYGSACILRWVPSAKQYQPLSFKVKA